MSKPRVFEKPVGMKDYLPDVVMRKRLIEGRLQRCMESWGYREIVTPTLEFFETVGGASATLDDKMFKLIDRQGQTLVLRPDMTAPIARVVASYYREQVTPVRLLYHASVYRAQEEEAGRNAEFYQTGVELINNETPEADAEVLALAVDCLQQVEVENFRLAISHVGFLDGMLRERVPGEAGRRALKQALLQRDYVSFRSQAEQMALAGEDEEALLRLLRMRGGEEKLTEAERLVKGEESARALQNLRDIWRLLRVYHVEQSVMLDLTLCSTMDYYTGMLFEGYAVNFGFPICSGGRYDKLLESFHCSAPATGFALKIDRVMEASGCQPERGMERICLLYRREAMEAAIAQARKMRRQQPGRSVELIPLSCSPEGDQVGIGTIHRMLKEQGATQVLLVEEGGVACIS